MAQPSKDYIVLLFSLWTIGAIAVPINTRLPAAAIKQQLVSINCRTLFTDNSISISSDNSLTQFLLYEIVKPRRSFKQKNEDIKIPLHQPATIIFTSGSSGGSKACLHTFGNHYYSALGSNKNIKLTTSDSWLLSLPLFHVAGIGVLFRCLLSGAAIALPSLDASLAQSIKNAAPSHISLVAAQLQNLLDDKDAIAKLKNMKSILLGGSTMPNELIRRAFALRIPIHTSYGSTEMASQITTTRPGAALFELEKSGRVLDYRLLKISGDEEILTRGQCLALGYMQGDQVTPLADEEGWFHTGDSGHIDERGNLQVTGRLDSMFISGGENIYPEEIERKISSLEGVEQVIVAPFSDAVFGRRPAVFVRMKEGFDEADLDIKRLESSLPKYKIPVHIFPWPADYLQSGIKVERSFFQKRAELLTRTMTP